MSKELFIPAGKRISDIFIDNGNNVLWHYCEGCDLMHAVHYNPPGAVGTMCDWNQDAVKPTLTPSIKQGFRKTTCHYFIRDGVIQYLQDCDHELAGKVVSMVAIPIVEEVEEKVE